MYFDGVKLKKFISRLKGWTPIYKNGKEYAYLKEGCPVIIFERKVWGRSLYRVMDTFGSNEMMPKISDYDLLSVEAYASKNRKTFNSIIIKDGNDWVYITR